MCQGPGRIRAEIASACGKTSHRQTITLAVILVSAGGAGFLGDAACL